MLSPHRNHDHADQGQTPTSAAFLTTLRSTPQYRLRKHPEYQRVYGATRKQWAKQMAYFAVLREPGSVAAMRSETPGPRIGLTVPKALGKAVDRNRIKRRLRALVRAALPLLGDLPVDVILHPKRSVLDAESAVLARDVNTIFNVIRAKLQSPAQGIEESAARG